jgi:hypothetical protein
MFDVIRPFYISLPGWPNVDMLCTVCGRGRKIFLSFGADNLVQMSGHLCHVDITALFSSSAKYATKQRIQKGHVCPSVRGPASAVGQTGK